MTFQPGGILGEPVAVKPDIDDALDLIEHLEERIDRQDEFIAAHTRRLDKQVEENRFLMGHCDKIFQELEAQIEKLRYIGEPDAE